MVTIGTPQRYEICRNYIPLSQYKLKTRLCISCINSFKNEMKAFQKLLNLEHLNIELTPIYQGHSTSSIENGIHTIEFNYNHPKYELIHEIGHFFLSEKIKYIQLVSLPPSGSDKKIFYYSNAILDNFVDYNIFKKDSIYPYYIEYIKDILDGMKNLPPGAVLNDIIEGFLKFFIGFNFFIRPDDKDELKDDIGIALENLRNKAISLSKLIYIDNKKKINKEIFKDLENKLKNFEKIKDTSDSGTIVNFIFEVLKIIPFLDIILLKNQIKLIYP